MLWARYALLAGRLTRSLDDVYAEHLESPGTKAFRAADARNVFASFAAARVSTRISFGELLMGDVGERHRGPLLALAKTVWPRWALRRFGDRIGLGLFVEAVK